MTAAVTPVAVVSAPVRMAATRSTVLHVEMEFSFTPVNELGASEKALPFISVP